MDHQGSPDGHYLRDPCTHPPVLCVGRPLLWKTALSPGGLRESQELWKWSLLSTHCGRKCGLCQLKLIHPLQASLPRTQRLEGKNYISLCRWGNRNRGVKWLSQSHTANHWQNQNLKPGSRVCALNHSQGCLSFRSKTYNINFLC